VGSCGQAGDQPDHAQTLPQRSNAQNGPTSTLALRKIEVPPLLAPDSFAIWQAAG
jgi:hypothetical protein